MRTFWLIVLALSVLQLILFLVVHNTIMVAGSLMLIAASLIVLKRRAGVK
jgi:hypothetical protein